MTDIRIKNYAPCVHLQGAYVYGLLHYKLNSLIISVFMSKNFGIMAFNFFFFYDIIRMI